MSDATTGLHPRGASAVPRRFSVKVCCDQPGVRKDCQTMPAIQHVDVPDYPAAHSPYSHAVVANGFVFVSGQIPVRPGGGPTEIVGTTMQEQTRQSLQNLKTILTRPAARSIMS